MEGKRISGELREAKQSQHRDNSTNIKESAKKNAVEDYKQKKGLK